MVRQPHARFVLAICVIGVAASTVVPPQHPVEAAAGPTDAARAAALRARGLDYGFNLDYADAFEMFKQALVADPEDAASMRLAAATIWMRVLFEQGAVTVDDYLGQAKATFARKPPSPELAAAFRDYADRAVSVADTRIRNRPGDADSYFQLGAAAGLRASYVATVEGSVRNSLGSARRAYDAQKRCLALDPGRKDAGLIVGLYQYAVASLPLPLKLIARMVGFESGRERGLQFVEEASRYTSNPQTETNALFALVLLYTREGRHVDALNIIRQLQRRYPRNRLLHLEAGGAAFRAGRSAEALEHVDRGLAQLATDSRPRAFGEEARWRYLRGAALVQLRRTEEAARELQIVLELEGTRWIHGRARLELGKIADLSGERPRARSLYQQAVQDCREDKDAPCLDAARRFLAERYR